MKRTTKRKILDSALELFNNQGIPQISMREIADAAEISPGNLTYHFKKRDEIVYELYFEFFENLGVKSSGPNVGPLDLLKQLLTPDLDTIDRAIRYRFIVFDHNELMSNYPKIKAHFSEVMDKRKNHLTQLFTHLESQQILLPESMEGEYELLARRQLIIGYFWMNDPGIDRKSLTVDDFICSFDVIKAGLWPYIQNHIKCDLKF